MKGLEDDEDEGKFVILHELTSPNVKLIDPGTKKERKKDFRDIKCKLPNVQYLFIYTFRLAPSRFAPSKFAFVRSAV